MSAPPPLRILWPISADGAIVVVRRGLGWPELRRLRIWRWSRVAAAWAQRRQREAWAVRQAVRLLDEAAAPLRAEVERPGQLVAGLRLHDLAERLRGELLP